MKLMKTTIFLLLSLSLSTGCGSSDDTLAPKPIDNKQNQTASLATPTNFVVTPLSHGAKITFTSNKAAVSFKLYFGTTMALGGLGAGFLASPQSTKATIITVGNLTNGTDYYFAVTAVDAKGVESEKTATIKITPNAV